MTIGSTVGSSAALHVTLAEKIGRAHFSIRARAIRRLAAISFGWSDSSLMYLPMPLDLPRDVHARAAVGVGSASD